MEIESQFESDSPVQSQSPRGTARDAIEWEFLEDEGEGLPEPGDFWFEDQ